MGRKQKQRISRRNIYAKKLRNARQREALEKAEELERARPRRTKIWFRLEGLLRGKEIDFEENQIYYRGMYFNISAKEDDRMLFSRYSVERVFDLSTQTFPSDLMGFLDEVVDSEVNGKRKY